MPTFSPARATHWGPIQTIGQGTINFNTTGLHTLVTGVPNKRIMMRLYLVVPAASVIITFESQDGTILSGPYDARHLGPFSPDGLFLAKTGEHLVLHLNDNVQVSGHFQYALVPGT